MNLYVGKEVWLKPTVHARNHHSTHVPGVVSKVGRRYVEVKYGDKWQFKAVFDKMSDLRQRTDYLIMWVLYETEQEILDEQEYYFYKDACESFFRNWENRLTCDQYRRILSIINESEIDIKFRKALKSH